MYIVKSFLGVFFMTLVICIFILLMQFVWSHVDDLVGKGVAISVLAEFFVYAVTSVVPMALPLAILLAALMTFGNLGERVELTAMKAAGISLFRIMRPLIIFLAFVCVGAFGFSNYVLPRSQVKLWTLIFSLRQKSPEMEIPVGEFYHGLNGYEIYVREKAKDGLLKDMMIYDFNKGFDNASVMAADSGRIYFTDDNHYLLLALYNGEQFENLDMGRNEIQPRNIPYRREQFKQKKILIEFDSDFERLDESILKGQYVSMNVVELQHSIDSLGNVSDSILRVQGNELIRGHFFNREHETTTPGISDQAEKLTSTHLKDLYNGMTLDQRANAMVHACDQARSLHDQQLYNAMMVGDTQFTCRRNKIEWWRKFTLSFACLIFFFIGAPLGAIIRKGGLGMPTVVSVAMFIVYYMIDNSGYKMARDGLWEPWQGMLLSSVILLPIGVFLTYKAATDSALFNPDAQKKILRQMQRKLLRHIRKLLDKNSKTINEKQVDA